MDNIAATTSTTSSTTSTTSSNENNENPIAFTDLEKEIEALSVDELAETVKKNLDYIETKIGEYSTNMKSSPTGEEIVTESKQITTTTVADRTSPVLRPTKSRSNSSSSSLTSYQDLPTSLHESFNACRNRITNQLERSFEQRHEQREEATMTESFLERVDNESPNIYSSSPQQQQQQQPQSTNSVDNDLMSSTLRRTYASPYLDPTLQVNTADYTSSFNENYMNSKIKPDYYYSTPDKTSSNNHNHNHDHLTTTAGTTSAYSYPMCRSAFESDPEVVLLRQHRLATRMTARPQSPTTTTTAAGGQQRYVTTTMTTTTTNKNYNNDTTNRNNDDDYMGMNLFSCRLKKEASAASIGKEEYDDDDTVESTHLDSDYAKSPIFPSDAYGSRPSVHIPTGIYSNKTKMESSPNLDKIYEESRQLDPEYIRLMDQKLRKMIKKTQYESINGRSNNEAANNANRVNNGSTTTNTVTWEIPVRRDLGEIKSSKDLIAAHPPPPPPTQTTTHSSRYLPEAQVPVHELVKKVRNEVESGASVDNVPHKLNEIWMRTQLRTQTGSNVEEYFSQQVDYDPLRNLIENPARVLIESNINPQRRGLLDVGGETQSKRSPRSGENTTTTTTTTTTSVKQSPTEAAAASTNKSTCLLHERILSKKLKHENRIKNLERLIELEKSKAKKLQEMISTSGKQQQQQQQKQHQESLSTSPPGPTDQSLSYIYESILNDEDDEDEEEENGNCQCCSFEGGHEANNNDNRYQDRHNTSIGLNSARIVVDRSPSNERRTTTTTTTTRTTAAANESNVSEVAAATSKERKIPIVVEKKRAESWFFAVDNPKFANSHESIRRVEEVQRTTSSRPISSDQSDGGPKIYPHPYQPEGQKYWDYDPMAPHKTLQEAFNERRYDVVINSSSRVREIKAKKTRRELAKELLATSSLNHPPNSGSELNHAETEIYRSMAERLDYATKRQVVERHREWCVKNRRWAYFDELATPHAKSSMRCVNYHHHQMPPPNSSASLSQREIKERTRRKYEKLPEVQQRLLREKLEENKVKNRIKSTIFKKTIQQRVLSNGPNFNLNFKALEYSIQ